jgi:RNA polymerase sigma-70 factor, ECF subfamily
MTGNENNLSLALKEFEEFIVKHQDRLVRHAFFKLGNLQEAEDVVQNTLVRLYEGKPGFSSVKDPVPYVFRMVSNACIDRLRSDARFQVTLLRDSEEAQSLAGMSREGEIIREEEFVRINSFLGSIPREQSEVIRLRVIDELSFVEIAGFMELPVTTVKSRFKYGLEKLKCRLSGKKEVKNAL